MAQAGTESAGGGNGQGGDGLPLHTDEGTHASYHYSSVLYLTSQGEDFEGGSFRWNDPPDEGSEAAARSDEIDDGELISGAAASANRKLTR